MNRMWIVLPLVFFSSIEIAVGDNLTCGSKIVTLGMTTADVLKYCGEPTSREVEQHDVRAGGRVIGTTQLNRWTYTRGTGGRTRVLEFDQDKLISIK